MGKLLYSSIASLDGFVADGGGNFDWGAPDDEVHTAVNDLERSIGTYLYGRRMYEVMVAWETMDLADEPSYIAEYARIWRTADKVVYSSTLGQVASERTRLERAFDPVVVADMLQASSSDVSIGGPGLATHALRAGLVDELHLFVAPVVVGAGTRWLPDDARMTLALLEERRFANGMVHLHYQVSQ